MKRYLKLAALLLLTLTACEKEKEKTNVQYNFVANLEKTPVDSTDSRSKVMLLNEQWINWEIGDIITIGSDQTNGSERYEAYLVRTIPGGTGDFDEGFSAAFLSSLPEDSKYFLALFPNSSDNVISGTTGNSTGFNATINLKSIQPMRNDSTFAREVYPMVAWYGGQWETPSDVPYNLDFHSLCGLVRLQVFNASDANKVIDEVVISSTDGKQLAGRFAVHNYNTNDPYLESIENTAANQSLTLSCGAGLEFNINTLRTFYIVFPALGGRLTTTSYAINVTVRTTDGGSCSRAITVPVRRTGLTNLRALGINSWAGAGSAAGLVGNGTAERPYKVYTFTDLSYLRNAYNNTRRINGQPVTRNTHIRLMRSDITIPNNAQWSKGIQNFCGHLTAVSGSSTPGITIVNNRHPLFESITDSGVVEGITLKVNVNYDSAASFAPFCLVNRGVIKNCVVSDDPASGAVVKLNSNYADLAGLCVENYGTLEGCRCDATLQASSHIVAGICLNNANSTALIKGCQITSPMYVRDATQVGGVCHTNSGNVKDCYFASSIAQSSSNWGGIVYTNSGIVEHCANMGVINAAVTASIGGVVHTVAGGTVDYCYCEAQLRGGQVGGIACEVTDGTVINSYINHSGTQIILLSSAGEHGAGGITATLSGGSIKNCFVYFPRIDDHDLTGHVGGIVGHASGGTVDHCYSYETNYGTEQLYGVSSGTTYTNCYLVNGVSQEGVTSVSSSAATAFEVMQGNLNLNRPAGGKEWVGASGNTTPPHLAAYSASKKKRR